MCVKYIQVKNNKIIVSWSLLTEKSMGIQMGSWFTEDRASSGAITCGAGDLDAG